MTSTDMWQAVGVIVVAMWILTGWLGDKIENAAGRIIRALSRDRDYD